VLHGVAALFLVGNFLDRQRWRDRAWRAWLPLLAAPCLILAALLATHDPALPQTAFARFTRSFTSVWYLHRNLTAFAIHWTLAMPLALPWFLLHPHRVGTRWLLPAGSLLTTIVLLRIGEGWLALPLGICAGLGAAVLWDILDDGWRRQDHLQLALGGWLLLAAPAAFYIHFPAKYLVASAPAAALLVARAALSRTPGAGRVILGGTLAAGALLGVLILQADATFAGLARHASVELIAPEVASGRRVWYAGFWGFQWYAEEAGARCLSVLPPHPQPGDRIVSSLRSGGDLVGLHPERRLLQTLAAEGAGGRIMSRRLGSGFYSQTWGYLPWAWGDDTLDRFDLWALD
jgi:hypothetical protein